MKKQDVFFITFVMLSMGLAYTATDIYLPSLPNIQHYFLISISQSQQTLTFYLFGLAIAQIIAGPIIDHYGYRKILLVCALAFILTTLACILAININMLIIARALQALFTGSMGVIARASFIKRFDKDRASYILMTTAPFLVLSGVIAPTIGGIIVYYFNWQSVFIFLLLYGLTLLWGIYRYYQVDETKNYTTNLHINQIIKIYFSILRNKRFIQCLIVNCMYLGILFPYLSEAPFIYHNYGYSSKEIGLTFIPIALAFLLSSQLLRVLYGKFKKLERFVLIAFFCIIIGFSIMLIPAFYSVGISPMTIGIVIAVFGMGFSSPIAFSNAATLFSDRAGYTASLLMALPFIFSTILTLIVHPICKNNVGLLALFLTAVAIFCVLIYFILGYKNNT